MAKSSVAARRNVPAALKSVSAIDTVVAAAAPVSPRAQFMAGAPAQIAALPLLDAAPRTFSTGSVGYYWSSKATVQGHNCQIGLQVTVIGSKHWNAAKRAAWLAAAKPLSVLTVKVTGDVKAFSTGSVGWNINAKSSVAGEPVSVSGNLTVVKSKEWAV